ncbi:putative Mitogen-activated protein kinase kinase 3 [Blattamonas nauphoetae]|uniref:non-specific serine/threonine protein kinase n=1 Tax=Blattamonas nauphoetae TaxID=2049346 RepID=A0ABQ9XAW4_9EUKA|nr:putative Mitogen-activated protein kinase kinase 3 [Blattamonas nauphoetae]
MGQTQSKREDYTFSNTSLSSSTTLTPVTLAVHKTTQTQVEHIVINLDAKTQPLYESLKQTGFQAFQFPYIVQFYGYFEEDQQLHVFVEHYTGENLRQYIDSKKQAGGSSFIPERRIKTILLQLVLAVNNLHKSGILHRNIHPEVIFRGQSGEFKLGDLHSIAQLTTDDSMTKTAIGHISYLAPERLSGQEYSFPADIFSLGMVLYELCAFKPPFGNAMSIIQREVPTPLPQQYTPELSQLIMSMLHFSPASRPTIDEVLSCPIFQNDSKTLVWDAVDKLSQTGSGNMNGLFFFRPIFNKAISSNLRRVQCSDAPQQPVTVFLDPPLTDGIFKCVFSFQGSIPNLEKSLGIVDSHYDYPQDFSHAVHGPIILVSSLDILTHQNTLIANNNFTWQDNDKITLLLDLKSRNRTLRYLRNEIPSPIRFVNIPASVRVFICLTSKELGVNVEELTKLDQTEWSLLEEDCIRSETNVREVKWKEWE